MNVPSLSKRKLLLALLCSAVLLLTSFILTPRKVVVYLAGDSTVSNKRADARPETGWGMALGDFFDTTVTVVNRARNGRSTRTFIAEGSWNWIVKHATADDFVLIQFGTNDDNPDFTAAYTPASDFKVNLETMVADVRKKGATPILITPTPRYEFDKSGTAVSAHAAYSAITRTVCQTANVLCIDLDAEGKSLLQGYGPVASKMLYNNLDAGEHPNYPSGKIDYTHFNELGARKMAELVVKSLKKMNVELSNHLREKKR